MASTILKNAAVSRASGLLEIIENLVGRPATGQWEPIALQILYIRYLQLLRGILVRIDIDTDGKSVSELQAILEEGPLQDVRNQVADLLAGESEAPDTATLLVLEIKILRFYHYVEFLNTLPQCQYLESHILPLSPTLLYGY